MRVIRDAAEAWNIFATECRSIEPIVPTTLSLDHLIDSFVQKRSLPQNLGCIIGSENNRVGSIKDAGRGCSAHFLNTLAFLHERMREQAIFEVTAIIAIEIFYNMFYFFECGDHKLLLAAEGQDEVSFVSSPKFERKTDVCIRLLIEKLNCATDWSLHAQTGTSNK